MNAELIAVGTELLLGEISNTDGQYISQKLAGLGINLLNRCCISKSLYLLS